MSQGWKVHQVDHMSSLGRVGAVMQCQWAVKIDPKLRDLGTQVGSWAQAGPSLRLARGWIRHGHHYWNALSAWSTLWRLWRLRRLDDDSDGPTGRFKWFLLRAECGYCQSGLARFVMRRPEWKLLWLTTGARKERRLGWFDATIIRRGGGPLFNCLQLHYTASRPSNSFSRVCMQGTARFTQLWTRRHAWCLEMPQGGTPTRNT